jgi:hypothetical protein
MRPRETGFSSRCSDDVDASVTGLPNKPLQLAAARCRDLMPPASRPWWSTTGSLVAT